MHEFLFWPTLITIAVVFGILQGTAGFLVYVERKVCAYMQNRIGPNRVGPYGLLQVLADVLKFLFKEETLPRKADMALFLLAPVLAFSTALLSFAVVPFGATEPAPLPPAPPAAIMQSATPLEKQQHALIEAEYKKKLQDYEAKVEVYRSSYQFIIAPNIDIGILFIFGISSLAVYGVILGGWSSNNKYSLVGALRASAQIISYEIPLGLSILGVLLITGSLNLERIIWNQAEQGFLGWNIFIQPVAFLLFMTSAFAECNRLPFDLPESEQELIGGYHTEYNAFKLAFFLLGEYVHMITTSFLMVILFFGGWHFPIIASPEAGWFLKLIVFAGKVTFFILFYMLIRWTIPRFRFDQLMALAWKVLIPLALVNLVMVMVVKEMAWPEWVLLPASLAAVVVAGAVALNAPPRPRDRRLKPAATDL
ncbi:MAG: NADH-quinone oxidoreductase subunit NuoH [Gemmataceae bacterium]|nr:NADH-quinone oxidoreductase subunit NuoH [Gemmataceae bacterium]MCI0740372.1 NADH-quinone oxidoreductase subunit NuoH [Gemmataceae bacterium]